MFEVVAISIAFLGSVVAGFWDLFTTEVPDEVPVLMLSFGIFNWFIYALSFGDLNPLFLSLSIGTFLLAFGLILYRAGHWGGADAWLLAAIGYTIPLYGGRIFMIDFIFNFLIVGSIYMVIYALILGVINKGVFSYFIDDVKSKWKIVTGSILVSGILISLLYLSFPRFGSSSLITVFVLLVLLVFFWRYARVIENRVFRKRIRTSQLRVGDVTEDMLWRGITADEINKIKKSKRFVVIKEGVRFVPVFPIALVVTLLFGNLMFLIPILIM